MRIDSFSQIQQLYGLNSRTARTVQSGSTAFSDKLQLSDSGKDYQIAKNAMPQIPDIRTDRVQELKDQILSGTYEVSPESFADKILSRAQASGALAF